METDRHQVVAHGPWAACFGLAEVPAVASLRLDAGIRACVVDGRIWMRGQALEEPFDRALRRLAPLMRFTVLDNGELVLLGDVLPSAQLPEGPWRPLSEVIAATPAPSALPADAPARIPIRIVRSIRPRSATMLLTKLSAWADYADGAPSVRLSPLSFAATRDDALIVGHPLPPIPGVRLYEESGIVVPCGLEWSPRVDALTLRHALRIAEGDLALFFGDGSWQVVPGAAFVQAKRSAVRLTMKELSP